MTEEYYLVYSRRKSGMHPWKDIWYSDPSSLQVLYLMIANTEEKMLAYKITKWNMITVDVILNCNHSILKE